MPALNAPTRSAPTLLALGLATEPVTVGTTRAGIVWRLYPDRHTAEDVDRMLTRFARVVPGKVATPEVRMLQHRIAYARARVVGVQGSDVLGWVAPNGLTASTLNMHRKRYNLSDEVFTLLRLSVIVARDLRGGAGAPIAPDLWRALDHKAAHPEDFAVTP